MIRTRGYTGNLAIIVTLGDLVFIQKELLRTKRDRVGTDSLHPSLEHAPKFLRSYAYHRERKNMGLQVHFVGSYYHN
ncbi:uncharacterized protein PHALS_03511 [Plasmopara halstedii]|uniref:Uncharacterized protein n=1 Tax=Plasmopara halstedii TaxID=4781 RepID=A0A0P1B0T7_PLAHL|nr:uncharacterized protein PHALS_03511 [Plasmopara halstedii]CEG46831.1 hypothetical protein PHALS_03511 [Plasmopara halstedii]|eukprot:XP_024583200.1 hypothetical protein PHALS_03511 [Plasmopara halstedii]